MGGDQSHNEWDQGGFGATWNVKAGMGIVDGVRHYRARQPDGQMWTGRLDTPQKVRATPY